METITYVLYDDFEFMLIGSSPFAAVTVAGFSSEEEAYEEALCYLAEIFGAGRVDDAWCVFDKEGRNFFL